MCNAWCICFFCGCLFVFTGCERDSPSPVELKIDEEYGYLPIGDFSAERASQSVHKVSNNQTLFDVAYIYSLDPMNLAKINNIRSPYKIKNGQVLKLPNNDSGGYSSISSDEMQKQDINSEKTSGAIFVSTEETKEKDDIDEQFEKAGLSEASSDKKNNNFPMATSVVTGETVSASAPVAGTEKIEESAPTASTQQKPQETKSAKTHRFIMPVDGKVIVRFGDMKDGFASEGLSIKAPKGSSVKVVDNGTVIYIGNGLEEDYGNIVIVQHDNGLVTSYAHLEIISVKKDTAIKAGQTIGTVGSSGDVKEPQLYFEVLENNVPVDPYKYLQKK